MGMWYSLSQHLHVCLQPPESLGVTSPLGCHLDGENLGCSGVQLLKACRQVRSQCHTQSEVVTCELQSNWQRFGAMAQVLIEM